MAYEKKDGDISIFKNETDNEKAPKYRGTAQINGMEYSISLWVKEGAKGKFFSGRIEPKIDKLPQKEIKSDLPF